MPATVDFLPFATAGGANVLDQASYLALAARSSGFTAGIAQSIQINKALRQGAFAAAALATFMSGATGANVLDDGVIANFQATLTAAVQATAVGQQTPAATTGTSHLYANSDLGKNIVRTNTGSPMIDTLPGAGVGALTNTGLVTITNGDATALLVIKVGTGSVIKGYTRIYLGPGQAARILSDGTNYWPLHVPAKCRLGTTTSLFVSTTGNDSNSGIASSDAFATTQQALSVLQTQFDLNNVSAKISHANGTYTQAVTANGQCVGNGASSPVIIEGDVVTPANVIFSTGASCFVASNGANLLVRGIQMTSSNGYGMVADGAGSVINTGFNRFDFCFSGQLLATHGGQCVISNGYTIIGASPSNLQTKGNGLISLATSPIACTVTGTPAFSIAFALASQGSVMDVSGLSFAGAATGNRYSATLNSTIDTNGGGAAVFPGSVAGSTGTGGQYN